MNKQNNTLILFAKTPRICRVKTRLWPHLNHRESLYLHKMLTRMICESLSRKLKYKFVIYTTHKTTFSAFPFNANIKLQSGRNLGMRMYNAILDELKHAQRVVLIGSDCTEFTYDYICDAFNKLNKKTDIVITPTNDGGYSLVGTKKPSKFLFENISWSTNEVLTQTQSIINSKAKKLCLLPALHDIDTIDDLQILAQQKKLPKWAKIFI